MAAPGGEVILIGVCDGEVNSKKYKSSYLTNKIGDFPNIVPGVSWQHPSCSLCGALLAHVVQIYCPLESSVYHRNLHVYACTGAACSGKAQGWRVFRSQCFETAKGAVSQPAKDSPVNLVSLATTDWCDAADDWGMDEEESLVLINDVSSQGVENPVTTELDVGVRLQQLSLRGGEEAQRDAPVFRPFYISVVEESELKEDSLEHAHKLLREYESREGLSVGHMACTEPAGENYEKAEARHGDAAFSRFMKRISLCPEQVLRYCWSGRPLFISEPPSNMAQMIPVCSSCGGRRTFELQLMPALVSLLRRKGPESETAVEFGTVLVFTCRESCWAPGFSTQREEFIFLQDDPDQQLFK